MDVVHKKFVLVKKFIRYLYPYAGTETLLLLLMVLASAGSLASPYFMKIIIDDIFPKGNYGELVNLLLLLMIIYVVRILCAVADEILYTRISVKIIADIRKDMLADILQQPISFFKEARSGEVLFTIMNDVENIQAAVSSLVLAFLNNLITIIGIVIMMAVLNAHLTLISLLILPFILVSIRQFTPHLQSSFRRIQDFQQRLSDFFLEKVRNIRVVKSYHTEAYEKQRLGALQKLLVNAHTRNAMLNSLNSNITTFFVATGPIIVLIYGGRGVFAGTMTIGALIAFIQYLNRLYAPTISVMESYNHLNRAIVSMERVEKYLSAPASKDPSAVPGVIPSFDSIEFRNVSLTLGDKHILKDLNLTFEKGKIYGIIGPSGSGKSSIVNLLCNFLQPGSGEILLDGKTPLASVRDWNTVVGLVENENQLFNDSIQANIRYGCFDGDRDGSSAIHDAGFREVLDGLPAGASTIINETGTLLSDGQKQRISIARALLRHPPLIIFDEATSSLDMALEAFIVSCLRESYKDCIIIIITHRLSLMDRLDMVYSVSNGIVSPSVDQSLPV
jgi:ATP-binding cassette, subfamily B, putative efflux pump